jgi:hypothetical protein
MSRWTEREFEQWFDGENARLPGVGKVLVIARHPPVGRMVDIVALDRTGTLVIIEVKSESATRTAIGQALEYLARYQDAELSDFEAGFEEFAKQNLYQSIEEVLGQNVPALSGRRRVYVAAPDFSYHADVCTQFLSDVFRERGVSFELLRVTAIADADPPFRIDLADKAKLAPAKSLHDFARSPSGRLYYVLMKGPTPVVWLIGELDEADRLVPSKSPALRQRTKAAIQLEKRPADVDVSESGTAWQKNEEPTKQALLLGIVVVDSSRFAVLARFVGGRYVKLAFKSERTLRREWRKVERHALPDWRELARQVAKGKRKRRSAKAP